ncbi:MAG: response regulator [Deltaproteobacteria bacterium]|nr:response regulator [Kofleriaceae bacterium]
MTKKKILVVDDNEDAARMLELLLDAMGYDARSATSGADAVNVSGEFRPDAAVLDLSLPDVDGFELAARLRRLDGLEAVRLVAVTGWSDPDADRRARELGFHAFLVKPVDAAKLDEALR